MLSLNDGQSFRNVEVCEKDDLCRYDIEPMFGESTFCYYADKKCIVLHEWAIKLIQVNSDYIKNDYLTSERLVLEGNITFSPVNIIPLSEIHKYDIPNIIDTNNMRGGQFTFSCRDGTFITYVSNVASLVIDNNRNVGPTKKFAFHKQQAKIIRQPKIKRG
jgi:hypothetical protein